MRVREQICSKMLGYHRITYRRDRIISQQQRITPRDASINSSGSDGGVVEAGEVDAGSTSYHQGNGGGPTPGLGPWMGVTWGN